MADDETKRSEKKSQVAQTKARDPTTGRFLTPEAQQQVQVQQQAQAISEQRQRLDTLFGRTSTVNTAPIQANLPNPQPQNNFQSILAANKPGGRADMGMTNAPTEADKWDIMLGKKRSNIRW